MAGNRTAKNSEVRAMVVANVDSRKLDSVAGALLQFNEIRKIYLTTGRSNLTIEVTVKTVKSFHELLTAKLSSIEGLSVASSNMIIQTMKSRKRTMKRLDSRRVQRSGVVAFSRAYRQGKSAGERHG